LACGAPRRQPIRALSLFYAATRRRIVPPARSPQCKIAVQTIRETRNALSPSAAIAPRAIAARNIACLRAIDSSRAADRNCSRACSTGPPTRFPKPLFSGLECDSDQRREPPVPRTSASCNRFPLPFDDRRHASRRQDANGRGCFNRRCRNRTRHSFEDPYAPHWESAETLNRPRIRQRQICRLRLAPTSGISALPEMWPSG
jgi:hypothetical protein